MRADAYIRVVCWEATLLQDPHHAPPPLLSVPAPSHSLTCSQVELVVLPVMTVGVYLSFSSVVLAVYARCPRPRGCDVSNHPSVRSLFLYFCI